MVSFDWMAIAVSDVALISVAFVLGLLARLVGLPPLVGFLAAGFVLQSQGVPGGDMLDKLADLGVTLLLFTVGLKLNLGMLARPHVWAVTSLHMVLCVLAGAAGLFALIALGVPSNLDTPGVLLIAFALSFSSTVLVVKVLEERGEMTSLHGRIAVGILIMQDLAAVVFLVLSTGKVPSLWALLLLLLIPARGWLQGLMVRVGHGELLVLYGFLLALGGAELFELVSLKGDLGALVIGVLMAGHPKAEELAKTMLGFKDLFLLGFFLSIGLQAQPTVATAMVGLALVPFVLLKGAAMFGLLLLFRVRARTALMATTNLSSYSEFGLIVGAVGVTAGVISADWLVVIAIALSVSFVLAAALNRSANAVYTRHRARLRRWQHNQRLADDPVFDTGGASVAVIGMGRVGTSAYEHMRELYGDTVIGVDADPIAVADHVEKGRRVLRGDPADADFWDKVSGEHGLELVLLALPRLQASLAVMEQLAAAPDFTGEVAATAKFPDEVAELEGAGVGTVFDFYSEAGAGFATHVLAELGERGELRV